MISPTPAHEVHKYLIEHPAPVKGMAIDIVAYEDHIGVRLYREDWNTLPDSKQQAMAEYLGDMMLALNVESALHWTIEMQERP
jgi:hypothetical protein